MFFVEGQGADLLNEALTLRAIGGAGVSADALPCLLEASKHRQIVMAKAENGELLASLACAKISKYTLRVLAANPEHKLKPFEYCEGKILFVLDGFFRKNSCRKALAVLAPQFARSRLIAFVRNGRLRVFYNRNGKASPVRLAELSEVSPESATVRVPVRAVG